MMTLSEFNKLTNAEEYFEFFQLSYSPQIVHVNRLHILKQFAKFMAEIDQNFPSLHDDDRLMHYRAALIRAYQVFLEKSPLETKLFKVFNQKPHNVVMLTEIQGI